MISAKTALETARKTAEEKQQKVMEQATVVSDLKNQLAELRRDIADNPTPEVSEDGGPAPTPQVPPQAPPPGVPPENTLLDPARDDMDADLCEETNPLAAKRRGEFGTIDVPSTKQDFQQWNAGLDRESVREALAHFQALNEQQERENLQDGWKPNVSLPAVQLQTLSNSMGSSVWTLVSKKNFFFIK